MNVTLNSRRCDCGELMAPAMDHVCFACWLLVPEAVRGHYIRTKERAYGFVGVSEATKEYQAAAAAVVLSARTHRISKEEQ